MEQGASPSAGGSRAARRRAKAAKKRTRQMQLEPTGAASADKQQKRARQEAETGEEKVVALRFEDVLEAVDADEVAELLFALANATHVLYRTAGGVLTIRQDPAIAHTGGCVWDAAFALARWAPAQIRTLQAQASPPRRLRCLEVGAGCGLLGLLVAHLGCDVLITEQPSAMANLRANVAANPATSVGGTAAAAQLSWTDDAEVAAAAGRGPWDLLLGTDIVYSLELVDPLLRTLHACATTHTQVWLCLQQREPIATARLLERARDFFASVRQRPIGAEDEQSNVFAECFLVQLEQRRPHDCGQQRHEGADGAAAADAATRPTAPPASELVCTTTVDNALP